MENNNNVNNNNDDHAMVARASCRRWEECWTDDTVGYLGRYGARARAWADRVVPWWLGRFDMCNFMVF